MPDVLMNYDMMEEASRAFKTAQQQMEETATAMKNVVKLLSDGVLLGQAGDRMSDVMQGKLIPKCSGFAAKFEELSGDIMGALVDLRDGDHESASRFKA